MWARGFLMQKHWQFDVIIIVLTLVVYSIKSQDIEGNYVKISYQF